MFSDTLRKINQVLDMHGILLIMITHPCFWPIYWKLYKTSWFNYSKEQYIEHNYSISLVKSMGKATFIHRPLQQYYNAIQNAGFNITNIIEPQPFGEIPNEYIYDYPRFLFFKCMKSQSL